MYFTMKKILMMTCAAVVLMACGGKSDSKATVEILEKMGVKTDSLMILSDSLVISLDRQLTSLDAEQTVKLCGNIEPQIKDDEQMEGLVSVAAAKTLDSGVPLLFLWHEYGDGGVMFACTYDKEGRFIDGIELGPWSHKLETPGDGTYTSEEVSNKGVFTADGFVLNRTLVFTQKEEDMSAKWSIVKSYTYGVDDKGKITLKDTKVSQEGKVPADRLLSDDIADMARFSATDPQVLAMMEKLAARDDVKKSEDHTYELAVEAAGLFEKASDSFVKWAAAHTTSPLMAYVQKAVEAGAIDKVRFDAEVDNLADADGKTALQDIAKTWKVEDTADIDDGGDDLGDVVSDDFIEDF